MTTDEIIHHLGLDTFIPVTSTGKIKSIQDVVFCLLDAPLDYNSTFEFKDLEEANTLLNK